MVQDVFTYVAAGSAQLLLLFYEGAYLFKMEILVLFSLII